MRVHILTLASCLAAGDADAVWVSVKNFSASRKKERTFFFLSSPLRSELWTETPLTQSISGPPLRHLASYSPHCPPTLRRQQIIRSAPRLFSAGVQILSPTSVQGDKRKPAGPHRLVGREPVTQPAESRVSPALLSPPLGCHGNQDGGR